MKASSAISLADYSFSFDDGSQIGVGASGSIYRCHRKSDGRAFAVKRLYHCSDSQREIEAWQSCSPHPHVAELVEVIETDFLDAGHPLLNGISGLRAQSGARLIVVIMALYAKDAFSFLVSDPAVLNDSKAGAILYQLGIAIEHVHATGYVHGDVKLENVLIQSADPIHVRLCDFGFARKLSQHPKPLKRAFTRTYVSPEMIHCLDHYDRCKEMLPVGTSADIWAFGVAAFAVMTRSLPFTALPHEYGRNDPSTITASLRYNILECKLPRDGVRWFNLTSDKRSLLNGFLTVDVKSRPSASTALKILEAVYPKAPSSTVSGILVSKAHNHEKIVFENTIKEFPDRIFSSLGYMIQNQSKR